MLAPVRSVHFVGIAGTAMASAAAAMHQRGFAITGSDHNIYPPMSDFLASRGIPVHAPYHADNLRHRPDLVVIGNAISRGNPEAEAVLDGKLRYCSLPELLKEFFIRGRRSLVVTGTHGKTTTTSLLAWTLEHAGLNPSFLIGGIPRNLHQGARFTDSPWFVIEGDEYDTAFFDKRSKFVHYLPEVVVMNNLEFDHADIFPSLPDIQLSFQRLAVLVPRNGLLLANGDDPNLQPILAKAPCPVRTFGLGPSNDLRAVDIDLAPGHSAFTLGTARFQIPLVGEFNVRNALAVVAAARNAGIPDDAIQAAFDSFLGIARRMDIRGESGGVTVVDDFAHHPTALRETLRALRVRFAGRRLWAIFEPRSNTTRRNVFQADLAGALALADHVVVSKVARLELLQPGERLDPERLIRDIQSANVPAAYLPDAPAIVEHVAAQARPGDVACVFSNGGFDNIHDRLLRRLAGTIPLEGR
ncbi:MAG: UDP-N-acetylmuramate:L-alanyl-gamma-D-glutamyl-meso-diaminopimelate ligase [Verrucomicrobiota bacterium]|jgi:UDP-N-acetylmuramate: L-alanyl-gamma-D-glutamyl-meso-diaminopimelate ligase